MPVWQNTCENILEGALGWPSRFFVPYHSYSPGFQVSFMVKLFSLSFLLTIAAYGLSFLSVRIPLVDTIISAAAALAAVALFRKSVVWGVSFVLAELVFGSFGRVFVLDLGTLALSARQLIFLVALGFSMAALLDLKKRQGIRQTTLWPIGLVIAFLGYGVLRGIIAGNTLENVIGDANGYLPLFLAPIFILAAKEDGGIRKILFVIFGVSAALSVLTFAVLWIFTHDLPEPVLRAIYTWIRDERIGEITRAPGGFYRVFFQSHVWSLVGYFLALGYHESITKKARALPALVVVLAAGTLLVSFSRAFWLAQATGLVVGGGLIIAFKHLRSKGWRALSGTALLTVLGFLLALGITRSVGGVLAPRLLSVSGEAAADSRWNLLPVMWKAIGKHPMLGYGFGKELTYTTRDPRLIAQNGTDQYTTYSFEWGYLDFWLKMGLGGLVAYLLLIGWIIRDLWLRLRGEGSRSNQNTWQTVGILSGFIALVVVHAFSPYLNHPLGIGFLLLTWGYANHPTNVS